jgi:hypothetical protein
MSIRYLRRHNQGCSWPIFALQPRVCTCQNEAQPYWCPLVAKIGGACVSHICQHLAQPDTTVLLLSSQVFCSGAIMVSLPLSIRTYSAENIPAGAGLPALTTVFTPPADCSTRWIQPDSNSLSIWSGVARAYYESGVLENYWRDCNAFSQQVPYYSPGVCASGQQLGTIRR